MQQVVATTENNDSDLRDNDGIMHPIDQQLDMEGSFQVEASETADYKEGVAAFLEKRPPVFTGK